MEKEEEVSQEKRTFFVNMRDQSVLLLKELVMFYAFHNIPNSPLNQDQNIEVINLRRSLKCFPG